jgi:PPOX class probable F420-dependent enzyme
VPGGSCTRLEDVTAPARTIVEEARRASLATVGPDDLPHVVPVCFAIEAGEIVSAVDQKPKSGKRLARVRNIKERPGVTVMVDRWDEDWRRLGWVMIRGLARLEDPGSASGPLAARYPQYRRDPPEGPVIRVTPQSILWWTWE